jgi:uncharacterized protein (TIGR03437 family)
MRKPNNVLLSVASVTIPAGASRATFSVFGGRLGVEEFAAEPSAASYETAVARVQVNPASSLRLSAQSGSGDLAVIRVSDQNRLPYGGVPVTASTLGGGTVDPPSLLTGPSGRVSFNWSPSAGSTLLASVEGVVGGPVITPGGVVNGASFGPRLGIGAFVTIFGERLVGAQLRINGAVVPTIFTSDKQINFLSPATLSPGPADVAVETPLGVSIARVVFNTWAPGIFVPASGFFQVGAAQQTTTLSFWTTGVWEVSEALHVRVDGAELALLLLPISMPPLGLQHIFVALPPLPAGTHTLSLIANGVVSNTVKLQVGLGN